MEPLALEWAFLQMIQNTLRSDALDGVMSFITHLGSGGVIWILLSLLLFLRPATRRQGLLLLLTMLIGLIIGNGLIKNLVCRPRPCWIDTSVAMAIAVPADYSFPSGHTLNSVIAAYGLMKTDSRFGPPAWLLAALIAFSRMYLYVHFPSDILAGALLALLIAVPVWHRAERTGFLPRNFGSGKRGER